MPDSIEARGTPGSSTSRSRESAFPAYAIRVSAGAGLFLSLLVGPVSSTAHPKASRVGANDVVGELIYPQGNAVVPAVLVLGGAEGGNAWAKGVAANLAANGYVALPLAYFKVQSLEEKLLQIPLERFERSIDRLVADPRVDRRRIAIVGLSKGSEAALLTATRDRRIKAVVVGSPSDMVWQGIDRKDNTVASSWTRVGVPLPFVPFAKCVTCTTLTSLYRESRKAAEPEAAIPVERIAGPIMMISSVNDRVWPSAEMSYALEMRLKAKKFRYRVYSLSYPEGGHFTLGSLSPDKAAGDAEFGGGTADGVLHARRDSWPRMLAFLDWALRFHRPTHQPAR